jgi:rhodanese-related sulfurtransferase
MRIIFGILIGAALTYFYVGNSATSTEISNDQKIAAYYANSVATLVSPHSIRERISYGRNDEFVLVDVRAAEDYEREHIITAVNIDTGRELDVVLADFKALQAANPDKDIIIYCYSASCMNGRKAGNFLAENGVFVKEMTIGWNEWRYDWEAWNYDTEWGRYDPADYVVSGPEPGALPAAQSPSPRVLSTAN